MSNKAFPSKECKDIIRKLMQKKEAYDFLRPVDPVELGIPDYPTIIKRPMDLGTVEKKIDSRAYETLEEFASDVKLIWDNCRMYNGPEHIVTKRGDKLAIEFEKKFNELKKTRARSKTPPASKSQPQPSGLKIKAKVNPLEMTLEEKKQLCDMVNSLERKHYPRLIQIIHSGSPTVLAPYDYCVSSL
uniref:Bromo domain-containing protein n=1 Tax=Arcella intermedia TaxID=1963864 RepID=A0A6B2LKF0_9EUKA